MASTNKTPQLGLNQWAAGDSVLREDFNADNAKLEAAMAVALTGSATGDYVGDGTKFKEINVGFAPQVVMIYSTYKNSSGNTGAEMYIMFPLGGIGLFSGGNSFTSRNDIRLTENGFQVLDSVSINTAGKSFHYIAFR